MEQDTQLKDQDPIPAKKPNHSPGLVVFRLILTVVTAVLIGGLVYFGTSGWIPFLDRNIFQSVSENQNQIESVLKTQVALEKSLGQISSTLEAGQSREGEILSEYQATLTRIEADLDNIAEGLASAESKIDTNTQINTYMATVYPQMLFEVEEKQVNNSRFIEAIATAQMRTAGLNDDIALIRILDSLSRANQFLLHSNYGLAEDSLLIAKEELNGLVDTAPGFQLSYLNDILNLVDAVNNDLPSRPNLAANKLELAWQLAISGLPQPIYLQTDLTQTPTPTLTVYPPQITFTPTPP